MQGTAPEGLSARLPPAAAAVIRQPTILIVPWITVVDRLARRRPIKFSKVSNIDQRAALPSRHTYVIIAPPIGDREFDRVSV
jgi:hypothetical protein